MNIKVVFDCKKKGKEWKKIDEKVKEEKLSKNKYDLVKKKRKKIFKLKY